jgi:hypothetical protein
METQTGWQTGASSFAESETALKGEAAPPHVSNSASFWEILLS